MSLPSLQLHSPWRTIQRFNDSRGHSLITRSALEVNPFLTISVLAERIVETSSRRWLIEHTSLITATSCVEKAVDRPITDLTGRKFGKWIVLPRTDFDSNDRHCKWLVQCECGRLRLVAGEDLLNGRSSSCGCTSSHKNSGEGKTSGRGVALRTRLQRVMNELRPETTEPWVKSEAARESGLIEDTESDRRMIV